jgi:hypothetical protein
MTGVQRALRTNGALSHGSALNMLEKITIGI